MNDAQYRRWTQDHERMKSVVNAASAFISLRQWQEALTALRTVPLSQLRALDVLLARLYILIGLQEWEEAHAFAEWLAELFWMNAECLYQLARLQAHHQDHVSATATIQRCIKADAKYASIIANDRTLSGLW